MATTEALKLIQKIPQRIKHLVVGYNRNINNDISINIPPLIQSLCLLYYYRRDYFAAAYELYHISQNQLTVKQTSDDSDWKRMVFCNEWYKSMSNQIIKWIFHIDKNYEDGRGMCFTLISMDHGLVHDYDDPTEDGEHTYFHANSGLTKSDGNQLTMADESEAGKYRRFGTGDEVSYTLDLKDGEWKCKINDEREWLITKVTKDEKVRYKLTLSIFFLDDIVTMKEFSCNFA